MAHNHIVLKEILPMEKLTALKTQIRSALKDEKIQHATIEFEIPNEECALQFNCISNEKDTLFSQESVKNRNLFC